MNREKVQRKDDRRKENGVTEFATAFRGTSRPRCQRNHRGFLRIVSAT